MTPGSPGRARTSTQPLRKVCRGFPLTTAGAAPSQAPPKGDQRNRADKQTRTERTGGVTSAGNRCQQMSGRWKADGGISRAEKSETELPLKGWAVNKKGD